ncbi:DUF2867 domain-containing protein [Aurantibacter sp.]|uniref:DUF2867 domain-containing protein n=1 Tax=Aurantibacter sp. TaxID=2807103 RepID=UPI003263B2ED
MQKVKEEKTRLTDSLSKLLKKIDFIDTYTTTNHTNNIEEITNLVFNTTPTWIKVLFIIRNKIVGIFGLKTEKPVDYNENYEVGGYVKYFKIYGINEDEIILGADDAHLNFRAIVTNKKTDLHNIKVTTLVEYNNLKGKIYMGIIKPFHRKIVKRMVRNAFSENKINL